MDIEVRKLAKTSVGFEHPAKGDSHCSQCRHFIADEHACHIVAGRISPRDWCDRFDSRRAARDKARAEHYGKIL